VAQYPLPRSITAQRRVSKLMQLCFHRGSVIPQSALFPFSLKYSTAAQLGIKASSNLSVPRYLFFFDSKRCTSNFCPSSSTNWRTIVLTLRGALHTEACSLNWSSSSMSLQNEQTNKRMIGGCHQNGKMAAASWRHGRVPQRKNSC
jgi:hypothetical protein